MDILEINFVSLVFVVIAIGAIGVKIEKTGIHAWKRALRNGR